MAQVASGLSVRKIIPGVRTRLDNENLERGVCVSQSSSDEAARSSSYRRNQFAAHNVGEALISTSSEDHIELSIGSRHGREKTIWRNNCMGLRVKRGPCFIVHIHRPIYHP